MRFLQTLTLTLALPVVTWAQSNSALNGDASLNQFEEEARQRVDDYEQGQALSRDTGIYQDNYGNDAFWSGLWQRGGANSANWYQQLRILKIHLQEAVQHLSASSSWLASVGELYGTGRLPVVISRRALTWNFQNYHATMDGIDYVNNSFAGLLVEVRGAWLDKPTTDPTGRLIQRDWDLLNTATPDISTYGLAHAHTDKEDRDQNHPDISLFNLLITEAAAGATATNVPPIIQSSTEVNDEQLADPTCESARANAQNLIAPPATGFQPGDIVRRIQELMGDWQSNPVELRYRLLLAAYGDLIRGTWQGNTYRFTRPVQHSALYHQAMAAYLNSVMSLIGYYRQLIQALDVQLAEANQRDQQMLSFIASYRAERERQPPVRDYVLSSSQAREILQRTAGNRVLSQIPLINIAQYLIYEIGPPWASTQGWQVGPYYVPNPLYYTITAQLIRGLESTQGQTYTGTQQAMNQLKNLSQEQEAISAIQDLDTKRADLATKQAEKDLSYGDQSYRLNLPDLPEAPNNLPVLQGKLDPLTEAAMLSAEEGARNSQALAEQDKVFFDAATGEGTLIERQGLLTAQELHKTQVLSDLNNTINNRVKFRALDRNLKAEQQQHEEQIKRALRHVGE